MTFYRQNVGFVCMQESVFKMDKKTKSVTIFLVLNNITVRKTK